MQIWIASFIIIFALSQFLEWLRGVEFSLPMLALGGLLLSVISNYDKRSSLPFWPSSTSGEALLPNSLSASQAAIAYSSAPSALTQGTISNSEPTAPVIQATPSISQD